MAHLKVKKRVFVDGSEKQPGEVIVKSKTWIEKTETSLGANQFKTYFEIVKYEKK